MIRRKTERRGVVKSTKARYCLFSHQYVRTLQWAKIVGHNQTQVLCFVCGSLFFLGWKTQKKPREKCGPQELRVRTPRQRREFCETELVEHGWNLG
jgi:hypothetical protein